MDEEEWRPVRGYEGLYEVSNHGRVKSFPRTRSVGKILTPTINHGGYYRYTLFDNGVRQKHSIMSLVLEAFVGPRPLDHEACHYDGTRDNNHLSNLSWGTRSKNQQDRNRHGTDKRGTSHYKSSVSDNDVREIRKLASEGMPPSDIGVKFGLTRNVASNISRSKTWRHIEPNEIPYLSRPVSTDERDAIKHRYNELHNYAAVGREFNRDKSTIRQICLSTHGE